MQIDAGLLNPALSARFYPLRAQCSRPSSMSIISLTECGSSVPMYAGPAVAVAFRTGLPKSKRKYLRPVLRSFVTLSHSVPTLVLPCYSVVRPCTPGSSSSWPGQMTSSQLQTCRTIYIRLDCPSIYHFLNILLKYSRFGFSPSGPGNNNPP